MKKVIITGEDVRRNFGFEDNKEYDVVVSPDKEFRDDVWVFSDVHV
jgi:hypothetical protein